MDVDPRRPRLRMTRLLTLAFAASSVLSALGCAGSQVSAGPAEVVYDFEPIIVQAQTGEDGEVRSVTTDVPSLFAEAGDYLVAEDYENALRLYEIVLEATNDEEYQRVTRYNRGLALEGMLQFDEAADDYRRVILGWPASEDATYAHFRLAECLAQTGQYELVPDVMELVLPRAGLALSDRVEAHLRWGYALLEMREFVAADHRLQEAIDINRQALLRWNPEANDWRERPLERNDPMVAQAWFGRGRVFHELFREIRLVLPQDRLTEDLVAKTQLFEQSQEAYLSAVRSGNRYWSPAAGFMVGQLFEDFYFDVLATEVPPDFNELEMEVYFEELRAFIAPAMERAMSVYENNLAMSYRLGSDSVWVEDTLASIERVDEYVRQETNWEAEHRLIIEHRHPRSANYADHMLFRDERER
ncbi:MAG: tetratricopeptide (TPR) repeat protein [Bradymonadia bacterium]|jgi:tetratricopeptide (TPR) repeat protein